MTKVLLILNALLTFPFGIAALIAPRGVFSGFGVYLDPAGCLIARGYSAALIGYGTALFLLRNSRDPIVLKSLLCSLVAFNTVEAVIQGVAGAQGLAEPVIFANVIVHGIVALVCLSASFRFLKRS